MRKVRVVIAVMTAILIITTMFAGCTKNQETAEQSGSSTVVTDPAKTSAESTEPVKLEIAEIGTGLPAVDADFIKKELFDKLGIDIALTLIADGTDYANQLNVRIAGGNSPDLFQVPNRASLAQFVKNGVLMDLTQYMDKLTDYKNLVGDDTLKKGEYNGKTYAFSKAQTVVYSSYWIRKDWLDALKLQVPTTAEELLDVAKAFTENDPDGNGKKDTFGITGDKLGSFAPVFGSYGVGLGYDFFVKNDKLTSSLYEPAMKDALTALNQFIDSGVVDPDLMTNAIDQAKQKAFQGKAGVIYAGWKDMAAPPGSDQIKAVNPNAEWIQMEPPKGPAGQYDLAWDIGVPNALYSVPKAQEKDAAKTDKIVELFNYISTKDGNNLVQFGIKGKHFNEVDGKVVPTDLMAKECGFTWLYQFSGRPEIPYLQTKFPNNAKQIDFAANLPRIKTLNGFVDVPDDFNLADASRYMQEEFTKFVYGKRAISEYDDFVKTLDTTYNFKSYFEEAQKQLKTLGYIK